MTELNIIDSNTSAATTSTIVKADFYYQDGVPKNAEALFVR